MAITMGFVISLRHDDTPEEPNQRQFTDLTIINEKLDRILEEGRARDTIILQHILKLQQRGGQASNGRIAEIFKN